MRNIKQTIKKIIKQLEKSAASASSSSKPNLLHSVVIDPCRSSCISSFARYLESTKMPRGHHSPPRDFIIYGKRMTCPLSPWHAMSPWSTKTRQDNPVQSPKAIPLSLGKMQISLCCNKGRFALPFGNGKTPLCRCPPPAKKSKSSDLDHILPGP